MDCYELLKDYCLIIITVIVIVIIINIIIITVIIITITIIIIVIIVVFCRHEGMFRSFNMAVSSLVGMGF